MEKYYVVGPDGSIEFSGTIEVLHQNLEDRYEEFFGFRPIFQESVDADKGHIEIFLHSNNYEILREEEMDKLKNQGITENDSFLNIVSLLNIQIAVWDEEEIATCSMCRKDFHEILINMVDFDDDLCFSCLPK